MKNREGVLSPRYQSSRPTISPLNNTGGSVAKNGVFLICTFLRALVDKAAKRVAAEPQTMSIRPKGLERFAITQPKVKPGIAAGVKIGRRVRISEILNCTEL